MDAATKRRVDRSAHDIKLSDVDKDLARTLLGKKKKTKSEPFYRKNWFTIAALAGIGGLLALAIWFLFIKAPGPDALYAEAQGLMTSAASEPRNYQRAADGPLAEFLRLYPDHQHASRMTAWRDTAEAEWCDYQMKNRYRSSFPAAEETEKTAFAALEDEKDGKLDDARNRWKELAKLKTEAMKEQRQWGLLGEKYLRELDSIDVLSKQLLRKINEERTFEKKAEGDSKEEQLALSALRDEAEDQRKAKSQWDELKEQAERKPELRRWYLLAAKKSRELK
jgi:hypothetical protein